MTKQELEECDEFILSIRNKCDIYNLLRHLPDATSLEYLLPTVLGDLYQDSETIVLEYCVKGD